MTPILCSSGDLLADRRVGYADMLAASGDLAAAADLMADALALVPGWAAGWFHLGELAEAAGRDTAAQDAFAQALALDPADRLGATLRLDLLRKVPLTEGMPAAFVAALFDQYAPDFDASLVDRLNYRVPQKLAAALPDRPFDAVLDLGCGTGLMGAELRGRAAHLTGWDISEGMLAEAQAKGIYDALACHDLNTLAPAQGRYDLIVAADVFMYLGALETVISWAVQALRPGGVLAYSCESHDGPEPILLRPSRRYAHSVGYLTDLLQAAGVPGGVVSPIALRRDRGEDVAGVMVVAQVNHTLRDRSGEAECELA
ncbi:methyltransferase domain-containing protein [Pseudorhodobacter sp. E13]|nr:methyltransferase domain-containing protein [Pseudorhodobacter sp. E13]